MTSLLIPKRLCAFFVFVYSMCAIVFHVFSTLFLQIYDRYKSDDGFLYIAYSAENTLG